MLVLAVDSLWKLLVPPENLLSHNKQQCFQFPVLKMYNLGLFVYGQTGPNGYGETDPL